MQKEITKIEFVLENCEVITIDGKHIGDFNVEDITYSINRQACNYIAECYTCHNFRISIHKDASKNQKEVFTMGETNTLKNPLKRLYDYPDITSIYIYFSNQEVPKQFYVPWGGDSEQDNSYQKSYINGFGDLFIVISENYNIEDYFSLKEIEDKKHRDFVWEMYA